MKKLILSMLIALSLFSNAQTVTDSNFFIDYSPTENTGRLSWLYAIDGVYQTPKIIQEFYDSTSIAFKSLSALKVSNNSNTRLVGIDSDGKLQPYTISTLPFKSSSYVPVISDVTGLQTSLNSKIEGDKGSATLSGTSMQTAYTITHGLSYTPSMVFIQPSSSDAAALSWISNITSTSFTVNFQSVPAIGTNNISFNWISYK